MLQQCVDVKKRAVREVNANTAPAFESERFVYKLKH